MPAGEPPATLPKPRPARSRRGGNRSRFGAVRQLPSGRWQARYTDTAGVRRRGHCCAYGHRDEGGTTAAQGGRRCGKAVLAAGPGAAGLRNLAERLLGGP